MQELRTGVCISLCTTVVHNAAHSSSDYLPSYPPDKHRSSDAVYWRGGGKLNIQKKTFLKSHQHKKLKQLMWQWTCQWVNNEIQLPLGYFLLKHHALPACVNSFHRVNWQSVENMHKNSPIKPHNPSRARLFTHYTNFLFSCLLNFYQFNDLHRWYSPLYCGLDTSVMTPKTISGQKTDSLGPSLNLRALNTRPRPKIWAETSIPKPKPTVTRPMPKFWPRGQFEA